MAGRAHFFTPLGPLGPDKRAHMGIELLGSGQPALPVVMVWVPEAIVQDAARLSELEAQTESAVRLDHPNIIRVRGLEKLDEGWARIVEFADAESLRKLLDASRGKTELLWPAIAAAIVADACLGVHHAHETGEAKDAKRPLLHGGLRPDVLLVNFKGVTKVTGYGAAAFAPVNKDLARDAYTAPEQVLGGREAMTRQTDVYQLGAVLYECLTGVPPFTAEEGLLEQLILTKTPAAHRLSEQPELGEIAMKALSKKASDRYPTALAMHDALVSCKSSPPVSQGVVARWVNALFPPNSTEREERKRMVADALATTGATQLPDDIASALNPTAPPEALQTPAPPPPAPTPVPPQMPVPELPAARPATQDKLSPPVPTPAPEPAPVRRAQPAPLPVQRIPEITAPPPSHTGRKILLFGGLTAALVAWIWYVKSTQGDTPVQQALKAAALHVDAGPPTPVAVAAPAGDGGEASADAGATASAATDGGTRAPTAVASAPVETGAKPPASMPDKLTLEVQTEPPMVIKVDGEKIGAGAAHASLPPGQHRIEASDRSLKIFTAREIDLKKDHQLEKITVGKAQLAFDVPPGATVTVDGKALGTAPLQPVELYAGTHEAIIEYEGSQTVQKVPITADFNVTLTVHAHNE